MESVNSTVNQFSWRRALDYGMLYKSNISTHLKIVIIICLLVYLCLLPIRDFYTPSSFIIYSMIGVLISMCVYTGGLMFARRNDSLLIQVPATVSEKSAFQIIYALLFIPVVIYGIWYAENLIGGMLIEGGNLEQGVRNAATLNLDLDITPSMVIATFFNTACQSAFIILLVLLVVLKSKKHRILLGILTPVAVLLIIGIIAGLYGFIASICGLEKHVFINNPDDLSMLVIKEITTVGYVIDSVLIIASVCLCWCIYKHNKTCQVA